MSTDSLNDDMVKLVAYTIVSIKRDAEKVMPGGSDTIVVTDRMTTEAFTTWVIAQYLKKEDYQKLSEEEQRAHSKYLRVDYAVSRRWPRQPLEYEERQVSALKRISAAIGQKEEEGAALVRPGQSTEP